MLNRRVGFAIAQRKLWSNPPFFNLLKYNSNSNPPFAIRHWQKRFRLSLGSPVAVEVVMMSKRILSRGRDSIRNITTCLGLPEFANSVRQRFFAVSNPSNSNNIHLYPRSDILSGQFFKHGFFQNRNKQSNGNAINA